MEPGDNPRCQLAPPTAFEIGSVIVSASMDARLAGPLSSRILLSPSRHLTLGTLGPQAHIMVSRLR